MATSTREALDAGLPEAERTLARLRALPHAQLRELPTHATTELSIRVTLTIYSDVLEMHNSEIQVAVQLIAHGRLGFSRVWARGFRALPQGGYRDLTEKELYEYSYTSTPNFGALLCLGAAIRPKGDDKIVAVSCRLYVAVA
jgi:hypothetical protein